MVNTLLKVVVVRCSFCLLFLFFNIAGWSQQKVSFDFHETLIETYLNEIESQTGMQLSYHSTLINTQDKKTYHCSNQSVQKAIHQLFEGRITTQIVGNHIVLKKTKKEIRKEPKDDAPSEYQLKGTIIDAYTSKKVQNASIYNLYSKEVTLSNKNGYFSISSKSKGRIKTFNIAKNGYYDTILNIENDKNYITIFLKPTYDTLRLQTTEVELKLTPELKKFVPVEATVTSQNLNKIQENKFFQASILPMLGSNWMRGGLITNQYSLNLIAGYSGSIDVFEIGGGANIVENNVNGVQIAGGLNHVSHELNGVQIAGGLNMVDSTSSGVQIAGGLNIDRHKFSGVQIAGGLNLVDSLAGSQIAGGINIANKSARGLQFSGGINIAKEDFGGVQFSGGINTCKKEQKGLQFAGGINKAGTNKGVQFAGVLNKAKFNNGVQIGLINIADSSSGISIGLINSVKKGGYKALEIGGDESLTNFIQYKSGTPLFYSFYRMGRIASNNSSYGLGFGIGSQLKISNRFKVSFDISGTLIDEGETGDIIDENLNFNARFSTTIDVRLFSKFYLTFGPSFVTHVSRWMDNDGNYLTNLRSDILFEDVKENQITQLWLGGSVGLRYSFSD